MTDLVIGSGPAGLAATQALLAQGRTVTVVDAGRTLEPENEALRQALAAREPKEWAPERLAEFRRRQLALADTGIARFGSRFALRPMAEIVEATDGMWLQSSHARGGLSNVWGAAVLPWPAADLGDWPIPADALVPHYRAVAGFLPVAGGPAPYDAVLPVPGLAFAPPLPPTRQAALLAARLAAVNGEVGDGSGVWAGPARQAVRPGCRACGLCLYGCPYGVIFSAAHPIEALRRDGRIGYETAEVVRVREAAGGVLLDTADGRPPIRGERVFVAAGVLETARLMFESDPELARRGAVLKDSGHVFTPFLHRWSAGDPARDPLHTLAIAFVAFRDDAVSPRLVHSQLYGWNDFYAHEMMGRYGQRLPALGRALGRTLGPLFGALARRLVVAQTFLHSDHCGRIALRPGGAGRLSAELLPRAGQGADFARARGRLARHLRRAGLHRLAMGGHGGPPGSSFHTGGTFPMAAEPGPGETDILGRPPGAGRIHLVDSSVMPAIPASTITFPVMANAHRIATRA